MATIYPTEFERAGDFRVPRHAKQPQISAVDIFAAGTGVRIDGANNNYARNARKLDYLTKGGTVDVQSALLVDAAEPSLLKSAWRSFIKGFGNTLGIAHVRRPVESPEDALRAVRHELRQAIEVAKGRV